MTANERLLKILIQVQADLAGLGQTNAALDQTIAKLQGVTNAGKQAADASEDLPHSLDRALNVAITATAAALVAELAVELGEAIHQSEKLEEEIKKTSIAMEEQASHWIELAKAAEKFGDFSKLGQSIAPTLAKMQS